jgi:hypothetical protein
MRGGKPPPRTATGPSVPAAGRSVLFQRARIIQLHSNNMTRQCWTFAYAEPGAAADVLRSKAVEQSKTVSRVKIPPR